MVTNAMVMSFVWNWARLFLGVLIRLHWPLKLLINTAYVLLDCQEVLLHVTYGPFTLLDPRALVCNKCSLCEVCVDLFSSGQYITYFLSSKYIPKSLAKHQGQLLYLWTRLYRSCICWLLSSLVMFNVRVLNARLFSDVM